jgi:hypothetical protein
MAADQNHDQDHTRGLGRDDAGSRAMVCPECGEPVRQRLSTALAPAGSRPAAWSHADGEPLCPVVTKDGYASASPVPLHATTCGDTTDHHDDADVDDDGDVDDDVARVERAARFHEQLTAGATPDEVAAEHGADPDQVTSEAYQFDVRVLGDDADVDADDADEAHEL